MQVLLSIVYLLIGCFIIYKIRFFQIEDLSFRTLTGLFLIKIIAGNVLWWIYTYHYPVGDLNAYFNDGNKLFEILIRSPEHFLEIVLNNDPHLELESWRNSFDDKFYNDSRTIILLNTVFRFFSFGYFEVHIIFINFLSFIGLTALYKAFSSYFYDRKKLLIIAVYLLPSVLFWSSGVLKEGLLFFGIGILLYVTDCGLKRKYSWQNALLTVFSILILLVIKFYILIALLPGLIANFWISKTSSGRFYFKYIIVLCSLIIVVFITAIAKPEYNILRIISNKQHKSLGVAEGGVFLLSDTHFVRINYFQKDSLLIPAGKDGYKIKLNSSYEAWNLKHIKDTLHVVHSDDTATFKIMYTIIPPNRHIQGLPLEPTFISFVKNIPAALWTVLTVPFVFNFQNGLELLAALENLMYCISIGLLLFRFKKPVNGLPVIYFCFIFVLVVLLLAAFTTPVTGALVRYKTPALPFLMVIIFLCLDKNKLERLPVIRKLFS